MRYTLQSGQLEKVKILQFHAAFYFVFYKNVSVFTLWLYYWDYPAPIDVLISFN